MKIDSYKVYDDLALIEDAIVVHIVDALFTSVRQDWSVDDESDPQYIPNKPKKTSDFINDGSDGRSKYLEAKDVNVDFNKLPIDVKIKIDPVSGYKSVVEDNVAKINLSALPDNLTLNYFGGRLSATAIKDDNGVITAEIIRNKVDKVHKTGSDTEYRVLSDNNYSNEEQNKVSKIELGGVGDKALLNNGTYGIATNVNSVNGQTPDENKDIKLWAENIKTFAGVNVEIDLANKVSYTDKREIQLNYNKALISKTSNSESLNLIKFGENGIEVGDVNNALILYTSQRPRIKHGDTYFDLVYGTDLEQYVPFSPDNVHHLFNERNDKINNVYINDEFHRKLTYIGSWDANIGGIVEDTSEWRSRKIQYGDVLIIEVNGKNIPDEDNKNNIVEFVEDLYEGDWLIYLDEWKKISLSQHVVSVNGKRGNVVISLKDLGYAAPKLNTVNSESLPVAAEEEIDGQISLHKISKTGRIKDAVDYKDLNECLSLDDIQGVVVNNESWMLPYSLIGSETVKRGSSLIGSVAFTDRVFKGTTDLLLEANVFSNDANRIVIKMVVTSPSKMAESMTATRKNTAFGWEAIVSVGKDDETANVVWVPIYTTTTTTSYIDFFLNSAGEYIQISHDYIINTGEQNCHTIESITNLRNELQALSNRIARLESSS